MGLARCESIRRQKSSFLWKKNQQQTTTNKQTTKTGYFIHIILPSFLFTQVIGSGVVTAVKRGVLNL
jgi:hypothetical protein